MLTVKDFTMTQVLSMFPGVMRLEKCFGRIIMGQGQGGRVASLSAVGIRLVDDGKALETESSEGSIRCAKMEGE